MKLRGYLLFSLALALTCFSGGPVGAFSEKFAEAKAEDNTHEGKLVSYQAGKLVLMDRERKELIYTLDNETKVWVDGKATKGDDLKPGMKVRVAGRRGEKGSIIRVEAIDQNKDFSYLTRDR